MIDDDFVGRATDLLTAAISCLLEDALPAMTHVPQPGGELARAEMALTLGEDVAVLGRAIGVLSRRSMGQV